MTFFDRLKHAAENLADGASRQVNVLKLQNELGTVEAEADRMYAEAGRRGRELFRRKLIMDSEFAVIMRRIDALEEQLTELRGRVQAVQQSTGSGSADMPAPAAPTAAAPPVAPAAVPAPAPVQPMPAPAPAPPPTTTAPATPDALCPQCGARVAESAKLCPECGEKLVS